VADTIVTKYVLNVTKLTSVRGHEPADVKYSYNLRTTTKIIFQIAAQSFLHEHAAPFKRNLIPIFFYENVLIVWDYLDEST
jgi:hypothetical protein